MHANIKIVAALPLYGLPILCGPAQQDHKTKRHSCKSQ
jgi:hypothetical protein